jgi:(4S)-4-hydroxy-5-phosphonooxypentane-2,3-dione isomerase
MYVVTVLFELNANEYERFLPLMIENANTSRGQEPGCRQFDVCVDPNGVTTVFLYEIYDDRAAFDRHLTMPHFKRFDAETAAMIASKKVRTFSVVNR